MKLDDNDYIEFDQISGYLEYRNYKLTGRTEFQAKYNHREYEEIIKTITEKTYN